MKLHQYLSETGQSRAEFAKLVRCHPITVTKWITGRMFPRVGALRAIELATEGKVRANDFCSSARHLPNVDPAGAPEQVAA